MAKIGGEAQTLDPAIDPNIRLGALLAGLMSAARDEIVRYLPSLHEALSSKRPDLRILATVLAGRVGPDGLQLLLAAQRSEEPSIRQFAAQGLARLDRSPDVIEALVRSARSPDATAAEIAFAALGRSGKAALDPLRRLIQEGPLETSTAAMKALGQAARKTGLPLVEPGAARSHADPLHAIAAAEASVQCSDDPGRGLGDLIMKLEHADPAVRSEASAACGRLRELARGAVSVLQRLLIQDDAPEVRATAATTLALIGGQADETISALTKALRDSDNSVRRAVLIALAALEDLALPAVPALEALAKAAEDEADLELVNAALKRIQGDAA